MAKKKSAKVAKKATAKRGDAKPTLLSGGNPQIAKGDGDARGGCVLCDLRRFLRRLAGHCSFLSACAAPFRGIREREHVQAGEQEQKQREQW